MSDAVCFECRWWEPYSSAREWANLATEGRCHKRAPVLVTLRFPGYSNERADWPGVYGRDYCGDFAQREKEPSRAVREDRNE